MVSGIHQILIDLVSTNIGDDMPSTPVDYDPFATQKSSGGTPVDHDPFKKSINKQFPVQQEPTLAEKAKAFGYGAATGFTGGPGELEKFAVQTVPEAVGLSDPEERSKFMGRETFFPTIAETGKVLQKVGITQPKEDVSGYQTAGEIIGGLGTSIPSLFKTGVNALLGATTKTRSAIAKSAEDLGFKLSPAQVRSIDPVGQKGATGFADHNQNLSNKLVSEGTGKKVDEVSKEFIAERLSTLGNDFNKLYKGKTFNIDQDAVNAIEQIRAMETQLPNVAASSPVKQVADSISANFRSLSRRPGAAPNTFGIEGEALQRLRNSLTEQARSGSRSNAREIYDLVDVIDSSIAKNHPDIAAKLTELRPKYRNSIILEDLYRSNGIKGGDVSLEKLGAMLGKKRNAVRGTSSDIDHLGEMGRELGLRARWDPVGEGDRILGSVLGKAIGVGSTGLGLRSRAARSLQRNFSGPNVSKTYAPNYPEVTAAGTLVQPFQQEE